MHALALFSNLLHCSFFFVYNVVLSLDDDTFSITKLMSTDIISYTLFNRLLILMHFHMALVVLCAPFYLVIAGLLLGSFPLALAIIAFIIVLLHHHHHRNYKCIHFIL